MYVYHMICFILAFYISFFFFFFSSRRRHTRCLSDWSSDVCSSDLGPACRRALDLGPTIIRRKSPHCPGAVRRWYRRALRLGLRRDHAIRPRTVLDRKSTRLNSSHLGISYAVFCLKKKKQ